MKAHVLLCDHAQVEAGKLFISGAGIANIPRGAATAVAILIFVPWNVTNREIPYVLTLVDDDGNSNLPTASGDSINIKIDGVIEVGRPPGATAGVPIEVPLAVNVGGIELMAGRYSWQLSIDGEVDEDWCANFRLVA